MSYDNERLHNGDTIFDVEPGKYHCCRCKADATIISLSFEGAFCTTECLDTMWEEYAEACRRIDEGLDNAQQKC